MQNPVNNNFNDNSDGTIINNNVTIIVNPNINTIICSIINPNTNITSNYIIVNPNITIIITISSNTCSSIYINPNYITTNNSVNIIDPNIDTKNNPTNSGNTIYSINCSINSTISCIISDDPLIVQLLVIIMV